MGFLSPPPPSPATSEPHTPPLPPKPGLCRFLGTVVSRTVLINRQARGGWWHKLHIPGLLPGSWQRQSWAQASSLEEAWEFSLEINSFLACLRPSPCLWLTEHSGICSQRPRCPPWLAHLCREGKLPPTCQDYKGNHTLTTGSEGPSHGSWRGREHHWGISLTCHSSSGPSGPNCLCQKGPQRSHVSAIPFKDGSDCFQ